mmetsp:Transcript_97708/g.146474  ORF Transcript_97708/g.146474 Transcript_97708/m.146474 type:complete len:237 (+) Transcript_97708:3-713(+)
MEENLEELKNEVETLFIPQLLTKLEETRENPPLYIEIAKNLCKCHTFLGNHGEAENCWIQLETLILQSIPPGPNSFTVERNKMDVELSGVYVNLASLALANENHQKTIELYQKAADVITPWIFDQNDMSPVPSLISIATHRIRACVAEKNWRVLKDDIQTVSSAQDIIDQLEEFAKQQFDLSLNTLIFQIGQKRSAFIAALKANVNVELLKIILQSNPDIEIDGPELQWLEQEYKK